METLNYPKVLLVGRTNVGKSTLFNRMAEQRKSIVFEREGVTRDYIQELISWHGKSFLLVDTGGLSFTKNKDDITNRVQAKVIELLNSAALILFVCDGKNGLTAEDETIASLLRKTKKPVALLLNKADNQNAFDDNAAEFFKLGLKPILHTSGIHGIGIGSLLEHIVANIPNPIAQEQAAPQYKVALIGRPNVGKSSLMNLLIAHERSIVSPVAGTTREAIAETTYVLNDLVQIIDTPGVRRSRTISDDLEQLMVRSSLQTVKEADIVLAMIDASEGHIADQELKLLFYAYQQRKMVLAIINKTDLLDDYKKFLLEQSIEKHEFILKKIPVMWISCVTQKNVHKIYNEVHKVWTRCNQQFDELDVNETIREGLSHVALYHNKERLKVQSVRVVKNNIPTFALQVNHPDWFGPSELGCIENMLRKHYDLVGCPVKLSAHDAGPEKFWKE